MTRHKFNVGKWLPSDQEFENKWVKKVYEEAKSEENKNLLPPVQALKGFSIKTCVNGCEI